MQVDSRILVDVATDINAVKNNLEEAIDLASTRITQIAAPGADEVSSVITDLFGEHGAIFTDLGRAMTALQGDFSALLDHSARAYTDTELSAVGLMQDTEAVAREAEAKPFDLAGMRITQIAASGADEVSSVITDLFGEHGARFTELGSAMTALQCDFSALLDHSAQAHTDTGLSGVGSTQNTEAIILGGTGVPTQPATNVANIMTTYIEKAFPNATSTTVTMPNDLGPLVGNLSWNQSVSTGATALGQAITAGTANGGHVVVWATSQSSTVATLEIDHLMATGSPCVNQLSFILTGDPNNPDGGIFSRFPGLNIPQIGLSSSPATPANNPYQTLIFSDQYDGVSNFPAHPLNLISDANAVAGFLFGEHSYSYLTPDQVSGAINLGTSGSTTYYLNLTDNLPLLEPLRWYGGTYGNALADLIQPDLRVIVDMGYGNFGGIDTTPATVFDIPNLPVIGQDLVAGTVQGISAFDVDLGLLPTSDFPTGYPFLPVLNPDLTLD